MVEYPDMRVEQAAISAGYCKARRGVPETLQEQAARYERALRTGRDLMKKVEIREAIEAGRLRKVKPVGISREDILNRMLEL